MTLATDIPVDLTAGDIVDEVISTLLGPEVGVLATLVDAIDADDLTLSLDSISGVSRCVVEIDHELLLVSSVDQATSTATVFNRGRGYRGTSATAHEAGSIVSVAPPIPRASVLREVNNAILGLYPAIVVPVIEETEVTNGWAPIPEDALDVLDVAVQDTAGYWARTRHWELWSSAPGDTSFSGRAILCPTLPTGTTIQATLGYRPEPFTSTLDTYEMSGLPASAKALLVIDTACRLLPTFDTYRLTLSRVGDSEQASLGPASVLAREFKTRRAELLAAEQKALRNRYPARVHLTR